MMPRRKLVDLVIATAILLVSSAALWRDSSFVRDQCRSYARDIWFDCDSDRIADIETGQAEGYDRTLLHPVYGYVAAPLVRLLMRAGLDPYQASRAFHVFVSALYLAAFFLLLRRFGVAAPDSLLFTTLIATSAAGLFWLPSVESFVLGGLSMFPALWIATSEAPTGTGAYVFSFFCGLGVTVTNVMATFFVAVLDLRPRQVIRALLISLALVATLMAAQPLFFPGSQVMLKNTGGDFAWVFSPDAGGGWAIIRTFFVSAMVAPEIGFLSNWKHPHWPLMTFQFGGLCTGGLWSVAATMLWLLLLGFGGWAILKRGDQARLRAVIGLTILYQLWMHLMYGRETFLYSMHYLPLLVMAAALAARTRARPVVLVAALLLVGANVMSNRPQQWWARRYLGRAVEFKNVQRQIDERLREKPLPSDPSSSYRFWRPT